MGFNINISRNLEPYDKQFGGKVTFYKDVKFEKSITISGDLVVNGNITAAGSSGLTAENLKGGEQGSIPYQDGVNSTTFLPPTNAAGRFLKSNGPGQDPEWVALGGGQGALNLDDLQDVDNDVANVTNGQIIRYNSSTSKWERFTPNYLTAETSHADVVIDGDFTSEGLMKRGSSAGTYSIVTDNSSNWNTAFSWGNHASVGYIEDSDFSSNGFMKRTGAGTYTVDGSTYISNINNEVLGDLSNVNVPASPTFGHILKWTGSAWTAEADAGGSAGAGVDGAPAGTVSMWSGTASSVPNGYLLCDGSAVSRVAYTDLFNAIGTAHGSGDGSTTFNLPNLRNRFVVGEGTSYALAATGGSADATLVSHSHTVDSHSHSDGTLSVDNHSHSDGTLSVDNHTHNFSGNFNGNTDTNTHSHVFPGDDQLTFANGLQNWNNRSAGAYSYDANSSTSGGGQMWLTSDNSHSHNVSGSYSGNTGNSGAGVSGNTGDSGAGISGNTGSESPGTDSQGSSATNANLPPYYALCYVIKVTSGGAITATDSLTLTSTDAGAAAAPKITLTRDSATPAANDIIGQLDFRGEDSASNSDSYAKIQGKITDPTSGSEDGTLEVVVKTGGNDQTIAFPTTSGTLALTSQLASAFPSGGIIMWSGQEADIPSGWVLCNGANSTPDLRNRFVVGAGTGSSYSVNDTGGSNDATLVSHSHGSGNYGTNNTGGHSHGTNNTGDHSHGSGNYGTNNTGDHNHRWGTDDNLGAQGGNNNPDANGGQAWKAFTDNAGSHSHNINGNSSNAGSHSHNTNNDGSHSHSVNGNSDTQGSSGTGANRPPYYALCFIMKT
jgi:microcystin-dependent protein